MKVQASTANVTSVGAGKEVTARIKESPKAFHILSGALYSDKILAVVRELSTNAYDAHVQAGRTDIPFEVHIPSHMDPTFFVKDYGPGLSEDQIYNLYMVYFESSKQESDDYVGQLGLGCKSPFSYGTSFMVESRQNGIKKVYTCYKNENLMPAVRSMGEAPTDEKDGLTVSMAVRTEDFERFRQAARYALMYFDVKPNVTGWGGFEPYEVKYVLESTNWKMRSTDSVYSGPRVIQGYISYPIDMRLVHETLNVAGDTESAARWSEMNSLWGNSNIDLFVPIGQVEIAPSREALTYDKRTALNLVRVLTEAVSELKDVIREDIGQPDTLWEMHVNVQKKIAQSSPAVAGVIRAMHKDGELSYDGRVLDRSITIGSELQILAEQGQSTPGLRECEVFNTRVLRSSRSWHRRGYRTTFGNPWPSPSRPQLDVVPTVDTIVLIDDIWTHRRMTNKAVSAFMEKNNYKQAYLITSNLDNEPATDQAEVEAIVEALGNPEVIMLSELDRPQSTQRSTYVKKEKNQLPVWQGHHHGNDSYTWSPKMWNTEEIELADGGVYLPVDRYTPDNSMSGELYPYHLDKLIEFARHFGIIDAEEHIIGIPTRRVSHVTKQGDWDNLLDLIKETFEQEDQVQKIIDSHYNYEVKQLVFNTPELGAVMKNWTHIRPMITNQTFLDLADKFHAIATSGDQYHAASIAVTKGLIDTAKLVTAVQVIDQWEKAIGDNLSMYDNVHIHAAANNIQGRKLLAAVINGEI